MERTTSGLKVIKDVLGEFISQNEKGHLLIQQIDRYLKEGAEYLSRPSSK